MDYKIFGGNLPSVTIGLGIGESVIADSGALSWMSDGVRIENGINGGLKKILGQRSSGEGPSIATFTAEKEAQAVTFSSALPGHIIPIEVGPGMKYICRRQVFLCAAATVGLSGCEDFLLQELSGEGYVFLEIGGNMRELELAADEKIVAPSHNVAAFESRVRQRAEQVKGFKNEGLPLTTLTGPGRVYLQTMPAERLLSRLVRNSANSESE